MLSFNIFSNFSMYLASNFCFSFFNLSLTLLSIRVSIFEGLITPSLESAFAVSSVALIVAFFSARPTAIAIALFFSMLFGCMHSVVQK